MKTKAIVNIIDFIDDPDNESLMNSLHRKFTINEARAELQALTDKIAELEKQVEILEDEREYYKALGNEKDAYERGRLDGYELAKNKMNFEIIYNTDDKKTHMKFKTYDEAIAAQQQSKE